MPGPCPDGMFKRIPTTKMIDEKNILATLGFEALTPMQVAMKQTAETVSGVVLLSPTGSGKTLAYLLPLLQVLDASIEALQAVVIVPTRELAQQSEEVLRSMKTPFKALSLYGGRPAMQEHRVLREVRPHVVFATPGRLNDHLDKENLNGRGVRLLVIDEFDKCLELGFQEEMERAVSRFEAVRRTWLMSATDADEIPAFMEKLAPGYEKLDFLDASAQLRERIEIRQVESPQKDKLQTLSRLLHHVKGEPAIVFVSHRESVERVGTWLASEGFFGVTYHGGMEQDARERALYLFRSGAANVLVSTDLAARGLDIPEVRAVIHYHLPLKPEEFIHRNGRTARWDAEGSIYLITGPEETVPEYASEASPLALPEGDFRPVAPRYSSIYIGRGKRDKLSKADILGFLCKKGGLTSADIGRIDVAPYHAYVAVLRSKVKAALRQVAGEKIKGMKTLIEETKKN